MKKKKKKHKMTTCGDDDVAVLEKLMKDVTIGENQGWVPVVQEIEGKLFFCHDKTQLPFCESKYMPFPERVCTKLDDQTRDMMLTQAWKNMALMPLFASFVMPVPTVALMMTGIPSTRHIDELQRNIDDLHTAYNHVSSSYEGGERAFYETIESRMIIDMIQMTHFKIGSERRMHSAYKPIGWNHLVSTCSIYIYYSRIIDLLTAANGFVPPHATTQSAEIEQKIKAATHVMNEEADAALANAVEKTKLSTFISRARSNPIGFHTFKGVNYRKVRPLIEKQCVSFTYAILAAMEKWILTLCDVPEVFLSKLLCTAQPKVPIRNGTLGEDGITFQEGLRKSRATALPSIWSRFTFNEEFFSEEPMITQHLGHTEYQDETFAALVRLSLTETSYTIIADQLVGRYFGTPPRQQDVTPQTKLPLVLYDARDGKHIKCKKEFKNNKTQD